MFIFYHCKLRQIFNYLNRVWLYKLSLLFILYSIHKCSLFTNYSITNDSCDMNSNFNFNYNPSRFPFVDSFSIWFSSLFLLVMLITRNTNTIRIVLKCKPPVYSLNIIHLTTLSQFICTFIIDHVSQLSTYVKHN